MINLTINSKKLIIFLLLVLLMVYFLAPRLVTAKETAIYNSVSVSSDSSGLANITTKTIIDGVVKENSHYETSGTNTLQVITKIEENTRSQTVGTTSLSQKSNAELLLMIERLNFLIQYYVLLLNKAS